MESLSLLVDDLNLASSVNPVRICSKIFETIVSLQSTIDSTNILLIFEMHLKMIEQMSDLSYWL